MKHILNRLIQGCDLSVQELDTAFNTIMDGRATDGQIAAFLTALHLKGITTTELSSGAKMMRERALPIRPTSANLLDTCGTGGDASGTFNISTVSAIIAASGDVPVAKHGNRSQSSRCGSADVLEALGVPLAKTAEQVVKLVDDIGIGFIFAPNFHPAMKHAAPVRKELGFRTIFNLLGPLSNPSRAKRQLLGVYDQSLLLPFAEVLKDLGTQRAMVVHGEDGMDEITTTGVTYVSEVYSGKIRHYRIHPVDFGLKQGEFCDLKGGDAIENAKILTDILSGIPGPKRDITLLNAGAALYVAGRGDTISDGIAYAESLIDSGRAMKKLNQMQEVVL